MSAPQDVAIVGAGIVGAACAWALAEAGLQVTVIESKEIGGGATAVGMGHILIQDNSEAEFALTRYSRALWDELAAELPPEAEHIYCGTLWVAADAEEMEIVHRKAAFFQERGVHVEVLDARQLAEAEPNLRPGLAGGLLVPGDSAVYAPCVASWLIARARLRGASVRVGETATIDSSGVVRLSSGDTLEPALVLLATGAYTHPSLPPIPVQPRKGHLAITDRYPGFARYEMLELGYLKSAHGEARESVAFNLQPRKTGQLLIGSSRQYGVTDREVDQAVLRRMLQRAVEFMPALAGLSVIRVWTGFRAATPDKLPLIGPVPGSPRIWLATGHEGLGITTAMGTARLVADLILGRTPTIDPKPYNPGRLMHG